MAFDFPNSPTGGQTYKPSGGPEYTFVNGVWLASVGVIPVITSSASPTVAENSAFSLTLTANKSVLWSINGGADQAKFTLVGAVLGMIAKDYEAPTDADANNIYVVQVKAIDSFGQIVLQTINVTVTDVSESVVNYSVTDFYQQSADHVSTSAMAISTKSIGSADSTRIVLFALQFSQVHQGRVTPTVTCDGVEMMLAACNERASVNGPCQIFAIEKPTGATADFAVTFRTPDANPNVTKTNAWIVRVVNMMMIPADMTGAIGGSSSAVSALTLDAKVDAGGIVVAIGGQDMNTGTSVDTWTGVTQDQSLLTETLHSSIAHYEAGAAQTSRTVTFSQNPTGSGGNIAFSGACALSMAPLGSSRKFIWDKFDRANNGLDTTAGKVVTGYSNAGDWVAGGSTPYMQIRSNRLDNDNTAGSGAMHSFDVASADHWAEWDVEVQAASGPFSCVRMVDNDNFIGIRASSGSIECYRRQAGGMNNILTTDWNLVTGTVMRVEAEGTSLRLYRNGELLNTFTIASPFLTPTKVGLIGRSVTYTGVLNRWRGGAL